jgi:hypothetical protein
MQKLSRTSSGKNNKTSGIFHQESNKIEFAFFQIFYDFLCNLQESAKWLYYLRCGFAAGSLELSDTSQICPWFTKNSLERKRDTQLGLQPWPVAVRPQFRSVRRRPWPGKGWGRCAGSPRARLRPKLGLWWLRRWGSAATVGASHGGLLSGEGRVRPERHAAARALVGTREAIRGVDR